MPLKQCAELVIGCMLPGKERVELKLFLRNHLLLVFVQAFQFCLVVLVFWLAGFRDISLVFYSLFLFGFTFLLYAVYQYIRHRAFYKRLSQPFTTLEEVYEVKADTPVYHALSRLLKSSQALYQKDIAIQSKKQEEQLVFMDLWVHQMKTPLSVIDLTARDLDEPHSSDIREETERLKNGLNTVLYMARLRSIQQDFNVKTIDLKAFIQQVNQENKRFFIRNRVYPKVEMEEETIQVETDEKWLLFMVTQLVHNAVKYSKDQSDYFYMRVFRSNQRVALAIQDFGVGIPSSDLKRIFDAFYTGENGRTFKESTGVGLYVMKEVATYLGHDIQVESTVGQGTTFTLHF